MMRKIIFIMVIVFLSASLVISLLAKDKEDFVYDSKEKRDPFIPLMTQKSIVSLGLKNVQSINDIILEGIVWDAQGDSIAVLNGVIMKEGQRVENVQIKNIQKTKVTLTINEIEYEINLIRKGDETGEEE